MSAEPSRSGATWMLTHGEEGSGAGSIVGSARRMILTSFCNWLWKCMPRSNGTFVARNAGHPASQRFLTFHR